MKDYPAIASELDIVEEEDKITHTLELDDNTIDKEEYLGIE